METSNICGATNGHGAVCGLRRMHVTDHRFTPVVADTDTDTRTGCDLCATFNMTIRQWETHMVEFHPRSGAARVIRNRAAR